MKLIRETAPFIRRKPTVERMMLDVIIALIPIALFAIWQWRLAAFSVIGIAVLTALLAEVISHALIKWPKGLAKKEVFTKVGFSKVKDTFTVNNFLSPIITGLIFALIMPAHVSLYVVFLGALFASVIGKMVFGGLGQNIFNPAAAARVFVTLSFGAAFVYALPGHDVSAGSTALGGALVDNIRNFPDVLRQFKWTELFFGFMAGSMGEVNSLLILIGGLYLFIRRSADIRVFLSLLLSFALIMAVAGFAAFRGDDFEYFNTSRLVLEFVGFQLLTGGLLFLAVFMATDPITSPITKYGRVLFGIGIGILTAFIRLFASFPEGAMFALLLMNMLVPMIDGLRVKTNRYTLIQAGSLVIIFALAALIVFFAV